MESALPDVFDCPLAWSCPQVFNSGLGMRICEGRFDKELFSCRIFEISKLFQTQKSFWHQFKVNSFWRNSSDSYGEVFRSDENFFVLIFGEKYEVTFGWSQKVEISIWGLLRTVFKAFILFAWIMIWFTWESTAYRSRLLAFDQKGLD